MIIFSAVRSNHYGNVGFLADWRRTNVALTTAQRGLIVVGNYNTLKEEKRSWGPYMTYSRIFQSEGKGNVDASCVFAPLIKLK